MGKEGGLDLNRLELEWAKFWEKEKVYRFDKAGGKPLYSIDTPPPTVSGSMHLGHAFAYAQQDIIARYKRMKGYNVFHPFGFDDNGLATERFVERARKIRAKDFSREEFIKICLDETKKAEAELKKDFSRLGMSVDWDSLLYRTIDDNSRKISQKSFIDIYGKGRAYRKEAPIMWCPKCETAIAQAELEDVEMDSAFNDILFDVGGKKITVATTRPELLPACVAVFVNPEDERHKKLVGKTAKVPLFGHEVPIIADERADPEKGTGIVMCCTFGDQTDMEWYKAHNLPLRIAITPDGRMNGKAEGYEGMKLKEARKKIIEDLRGRGLLPGQKAIRHAVNVHERCKTEIEFIVSKQWFIKYLDLKKEFINRADEIEWMPRHMKSRYDNWIQGLQWDWCVSRQRYFGVPIPVWYCKACGEIALPGEGQLPVDPLKDKPNSACQCGGTDFEPEKDVFDTWATSSLTPQINAGWGIDGERFRKVYPMDLRPQGHDIITLWAFNTIVKGLLHHDQLPWKNIMINGWALDPKGKKMSKSLGNVIPPREIMEKYSADVLRYWASGANLGEDVPYQEKEMVSGRKFAVKLYNASRFVSQLADGFDMAKANPEKLEFRATDRWILSRLNEVKKNADSHLEKYHLSKALAEVRNFFWLEFADYYIEEVKYRLYEGNDETKDAAKFSLLSVMLDVLKMLAPFMPHLAEEIWQRQLGAYAGAKRKSIHLEDWPVIDESMIDEHYDKLGETMNLVIGAVRKTKSENGISLNGEIKEATVFLENESLAGMVEEAGEDIRKTMNITSLNVVNAEGTPPGAVSLGKGLGVRVSI